MSDAFTKLAVRGAQVVTCLSVIVLRELDKRALPQSAMFKVVRRRSPVGQGVAVSVCHLCRVTPKMTASHLPSTSMVSLQNLHMPRHELRFAPNPARRWRRDIPSFLT